MGIFYGISVGPGNSQLLTLEAVETLGSLDILFAPRGRKEEMSFALKIATPHLRKDLEIRERHFPMSYDLKERDEAIEVIAKEIRDEVNGGKKVGFITLGDSMVYSTYQYLLEKLKGKIKTKTIAGIPSFIQIASQLENALTIGEEILTVLPATAPNSKLELALNLSDTVVIMKVSSYMDKVKEILAKHKLDKEVYVVSNASLEQVVTRNGLHSLRDEKYPYYTTMIIYKNRGFYE